MKKAFYSLAVVIFVIYSFAVVVFVTVLVSCSKGDHDGFDQVQQSIELRALSLGYTDVASYKSSVAQQCAEGNHENCDVLANGTHQACVYNEHTGINHDGTHHNGTGHGVHDANGHSHNLHGSGNHNDDGGHH